MRGDEVVVIRVKSIGIRRGPAPEAQNLYEIIAS
jgi:ribosomal 50S subunit-recycling heat shock protein